MTGRASIFSFQIKAHFFPVSGYKAYYLPHSIGGMTHYKNEQMAPGRDISYPANKKYYGGSLSRAARNWKFHNAQIRLFPSIASTAEIVGLDLQGLYLLTFFS